jgi:hypothetical protein
MRYEYGIAACKVLLLEVIRNRCAAAAIGCNDELVVAICIAEAERKLLACTPTEPPLYVHA